MTGKPKGTYIEFSPDLLGRLRALARANGRSLKAELEHAAERHLARPPRLTIETPELDDVTPSPSPRSS